MKFEPIFTPDSLRQYLDERKGATFVNLFARSIPTMNKTNNPYYGKVIHFWGRNVTFGANYERSVNRRQQEAAPDDTEMFVAEQLWHGFGERINAYMARHTKDGKEYLVYQLRTDAAGKTLPPLYDQYRHCDTGEVIELEKLLPFMPKKQPSKKQRVLELGCRETFARTVKIDGGFCGRVRLGLDSIDIDGDQFKVLVC